MVYIYRLRGLLDSKKIKQTYTHKREKRINQFKTTDKYSKCELDHLCTTIPVYL